MHDFPLLINITLALVVAFIGGLVARRLGLPTIVGYLLAGIAIGPFTPGFTGDVETIQQLNHFGRGRQVGDRPQGIDDRVAGHHDGIIRHPFSP